MYVQHYTESFKARMFYRALHATRCIIIIIIIIIRLSATKVLLFRSILQFVIKLLVQVK